MQLRLFLGYPFSTELQQATNTLDSSRQNYLFNEQGLTTILFQGFKYIGKFLDVKADLPTIDLIAANIESLINQLTVCDKSLFQLIPISYDPR